MPRPLDIQIALHYYCCVGDFERFNAPEVLRTIGEFFDRGLLQKGGEGSLYTKTEALELYVNTLCSVPFPRQKWVIGPLTIDGDSADALR